MRAFLVLLAVALGAIGVGVGIEAEAVPDAVPAGTWVISPRQPTLRVLLPDGCPKNIARFRDVTNSSETRRTMLVPLNPQAALLCRYGSGPMTSDVSYGLSRARHLGQSGAVALGVAIDRVSTKRPTGTFHCPAAFATATIVAFAYSDERDADIWYDDSGCETLDNGFLESSQVESPTLFFRVSSAVDHLAPRG